MIETEAIQSREQVRLSIPQGVFIVLLTWAASSLITYGIVSTRIEWLMQRVDTLERQGALYLPRTEYEGSRSDLASRLERIERKIDQIPTK